MVYRCRKSFAGRALSFFLAVLVFFGSMGGTPVEATSGTATTSSTVGSSFYDVSTALTGFANLAVSLNSNDKHGDVVVGGSLNLDRSHKLYELAIGSPTAGKGGTFIGYGDSSRGFQGSFQSNQTNSVTVSSYDAYTTIGDGGAGYAYVRYGRLLNDLGIDEMGTAANGGYDRVGGGKILQIVYLVSSFVPKLFEIAFKILDALNPFRLLIGYQEGGTYATKVVRDEHGNVEVGVATGYDKDPTYVGGDAAAGAVTTDVFGDGPSLVGSVETGDGVSQTIDGLTNSSSDEGFYAAMGPIINYITDIYNILRGIGLWIIMPLMTAMLLFTVFVLGQSKAWSALQKYAVRFVFIVIGIPFLGITYTAVLDEFTDISANGNRPSTRIIAASMVDFQKWALGWRLDPPSGNVTLVSDGSESNAAGSASSDSWRTVRETIYQINYRLPGNVYSLSSTSGIGLSSSGADDVYDETYAGMFTVNNAGTTAGQQDMWTDAPVDDESKTKDNRNSIEGMLSTFCDSTLYNSSSWFSSVNKYLTAAWPTEVGTKEGTANSTAIEKTVYQMYSDTDDANDWYNRQQDENAQIFSGGPVTIDASTGAVTSGGTGETTVQWAEKEWNIFKNGANFVKGGNLEKNPAAKTSYEYEHSGSLDSGSFEAAAGSGSGLSKTTGVNPANTTGLSTISMYNYLSTSFKPTGIEVYSAEKSTSEFTQEGHYAVSMAGTGATRLAFWVSCTVVLGIYVALGFYYAVGMVISVLKHGFSMIMSIPAAMFGVMKSIVQVCAYVVQMITEILSSVFLYQVVMELVLVFATVAETPIKKALDALSGSAVVGGIVGDSTAVALTLRLAECRPLFTVTLFSLAFMTVCLGIGLVAMGRAVLSLFVFVHYKVAYMVTLDEFKPRFADFVRTRESLDIWDDMKADGRKAIGAAGRAVGKAAGLAGKEGTRV